MTKTTTSRTFHLVGCDGNGGPILKRRHVLKRLGEFTIIRFDCHGLRNLRDRGRISAIAFLIDTDPDRKTALRAFTHFLDRIIRPVGRSARP